MLLHNDVVTDGEPKPCSFSGRLSCEERVEHFFSYFRRNTRAVIPNPDFHKIAQASCRGHQGRFIAIAISFGSPLCCRIKAVRDQVQKRQASGSNSRRAGGAGVCGQSCAGADRSTRWRAGELPGGR